MNIDTIFHNWIENKTTLLDLGCGDGTLALRIIESGGKVKGIDASEAMVARARERGVDARVLDGQRLDYMSKFDAIFSNAALHWMRDANAVLQGVILALKPNGRFVAEFGGYGNIGSIIDAMNQVLGKFMTY